MLHSFGVASWILPSQEANIEETKAKLSHSSGDFITDMEQFFSPLDF